jgi:DNA transposition AAA+ family ATPase
MTEKLSVAPLTNVRAFSSMLDQLTGRNPALPGIGVFHGPSGYGKTVAATQAINAFSAICVEVGYSWTARVLVDRILHELELARTPTVAEGVQAIIQALGEEPRPLIIDEADHLLKKRSIELIREIHDQTGAPVALIGEEMMPAKLARWERVHNRVLVWQPAARATMDDVKLLAAIYCDGVAVDEALLERMLKECSGQVRRICVNLANMREAAMRKGEHEITLRGWGEKTFWTGGAARPARRAA